MANELSFLGNLPGMAILGNQNASGNSGITQGTNSYASQNDPQMMAQLAAIKKYDPNASVTQQARQEDGAQPIYNISYDQSKLPALQGGYDTKVPQSLAAQRSSQGGGGTDNVLSQMIDPTNVHSSIYGDLTPSSNVKTWNEKTATSGLDVWGPMVVGALTAGAGMLGGAAPGAFGLN